MHVLSRLFLAMAALAGGIALVGCVSSPPSPEPVDELVFEAARRAAPSLTCLMMTGPMYQEAGLNKIDVESTATATILPSGECLTAGHFLHGPTVNGQAVGLVIEGRGADATILERELFGCQDYLRLTVAFKKPPDLIAQRLASPERRAIRFDGGFNIRPGQTLFAAGFVMGSGPVSMPMIGRELAVMPLAAIQGGHSGQIVLDYPNDVRMAGMSGGPILAFDDDTGDLVVVGIVIYSQESFRYQRRLLYGSRLSEPHRVSAGESHQIER